MAREEMASPTAALLTYSSYYLLLTTYCVLPIAYCALLTTLGTSNGCKTMHMGEVDPVRKYSHSKYGEVDPVSIAIVSTARWTCFQRVTQ